MYLIYEYPNATRQGMTTTLVGAIDNSVVALVLADKSGAVAFKNCVIQIDNEQLEVTAYAAGGGGCTVTRGYNGTAAAAHADGAVVTIKGLSVKQMGLAAANAVVVPDYFEPVKRAGVAGVVVTAEASWSGLAGGDAFSLAMRGVRRANASLPDAGFKGSTIYTRDLYHSFINANDPTYAGGGGAALDGCQLSATGPAATGNVGATFWRHIGSIVIGTAVTTTGPLLPLGQRLCFGFFRTAGVAFTAGIITLDHIGIYGLSRPV